MSSDGRKPMAAAFACSPLDPITHALKRGLSALSAVDSVHFLATENALTVWVSLQDGYDEAARTDVYRFEDQISGRFPELLFDFHIIAVPADRKIEDFLSNASPIFQRNVA
jgi:hypothetical protein